MVCLVGVSTYGFEGALDWELGSSPNLTAGAGLGAATFDAGAALDTGSILVAGAALDAGVGAKRLSASSMLVSRLLASASSFSSSATCNTKGNLLLSWTEACAA